MKRITDIHLASSDTCTGCSACASVCPTESISMKIDREGFLQPCINTKTCIGCHRCEKICPAINAIIKNDFVSHAYNAQTSDEYALNKSSSGGAFYELSRFVVNKGGVVFGVKFNGVHVEHNYAETLQEIEPFMGSKYIQSEIGDVFKQTKSFLELGRWVLFTGTPCQIAGLKKYLVRDYEKLLTVDVICHGVPSPGIWEKYITRLIKKINAGDIKDIRFRIKGKGENLHNNFYFFFFFFLRDKQWHSYGESRADNLYYAYFTRHLFRASCYQCPYRDIYTPCSDITIGDAVSCAQFSKENEMPSTLIVHSAKGQDILDEIKDSFGIFNSIPMEAVGTYYNKEKASIELERNIRPWKLSNRLGMILPLEYFKWVWMRDKFYVKLKRKVKKICKRNTR